MSQEQPFSDEELAENPVYVIRNHWVTVWLGDLSYEELNALMNEPGGMSEDDFLSDFESELGQHMDPDFLLTHTADAPKSPRSLALPGLWDSEELAEGIAQRAEKLGIDEATCVILAWNARMIRDKSLCGGRMRCLGSWPHPAPLTYPEW